MKIQCACGAKYSFDVSPEMVQRPIQFVCPGCGLDSSVMVNQMIRAEFNAPAPATAPAIAPPPEVAPASGTAPVPVPPAAPRIQIQVRAATSPPLTPRLVGEAARAPRYCPRHPRQRPTQTCLVCDKPICPKCMELFGYVCSPHCKEKAELEGIEIPVYAGQKAVVERRRWRKVGLVAGLASAVVIAVVGFWCWFAWFGSRPSPTFSVRFSEPAYSGQSRLCGKDQIVFLHGETLARHDMKAKKEVWSCQLIDKKLIDREVERMIKAMHAEQDRLNSAAPDADPIKIPSPEKLAKRLMRAAAEELELQVHGQNIWVASPEKLVRHDWDTGKSVQEVPLSGGLDGALARGDELLLTSGNDLGQKVVTHINLATGQTRAEEIGEPVKPAVTNTPAEPAKSPAGKPGVAAKTAKVGSKPPSASVKPLDPARVAEQVQKMPLPARAALPATLAVGMNQERALAELRDQDNGKPKSAPPPELELDFTERFSLIPAPDGFVEFSAQLLESKIVERSAMKAPPKKSALDGPVNMAATANVANELLNEMQRDRGGGVVTEDESRYRVTIRPIGAKDVADWQGEVVGPPALYPLKTVNVIAAGKMVIVLDKKNKKLWQSALTFTIAPGGGSSDAEHAPYGLGPCVERGDTLYVIDAGVLSAFDLKTGSARWRLPSVGIAGLFFDDEGMIYVNSTTASHESIKYSRQIDVTSKTSAVIVKLDPKTGRMLWSAEPGGQISHLSGKYIYTLQAYQPYESDEENPYEQTTGLETPPFMRIKRINPKNGKVMWAHFQERAPLDVQFDQNSIHIVFKKEVQVLKFLSF